jgi:hypothetical protein
MKNSQLFSNGKSTTITLYKYYNYDSKENTIINGKINGKKSVNAPTVSSFDIFHIDKKHNLVV